MNKHIEDIIKSINRHKKGLRDPQIMHPEREWGIGIFLAVLIFILSATWSLSLYIENRNAAAHMQTEEQPESVVYRESQVEEALARLGERTTVLTSLLPKTNEMVEVPEAVVGEIEMASSTEPTPLPPEEVPEMDEAVSLDFE